MAKLDVRLVTARRIPAPDAESPGVLAALRELGLAAELAAWDDAQVDWSAARAHVIRSTWNYPAHLGAFLAWSEHVAAVSSLWNPAPLVRWNAHKGYLTELAARGLPVVPTERVGRDEPRSLGAVLATRGWSEAVVKPAVGLGGQGAARVRGDGEGERRLAALLETGDALVQPFVESLVREGECSLVCFGGALRHAIRKHPGPGDFRVQEHVGGRTRPAEAAADEIALAGAVLAELGEPLLYARVDLVRFDGGPRLSELELIEPSLYLEHLPGGHEAFARSIAGWLGG